MLAGMARNNPVLAFSIVGAAFLAVGVGWCVVDQLDRQEVALLQQEGAIGTARVISYEETGSAQNGKPRLRFRFEIQPEDGGAPVQVEKTLVVTAMEAPRLQVGSLRKVRYLPRDPEVFRLLD
ncbi:DUF3592 domain-containing protein [Nannocystis pusilla]|uniref:DUF3592 domain-containing protein n=1 Tax=Nannocystis pusilla TaxID=889268 RepID=A0A9X3IUP2_9BACT|nr:DUF3592 domain-containing protein [Nannocystis pusilla]MCY1005367.1 DUF3592 domain-containing protein [Nannocystis pusilla]